MNDTWQTIHWNTLTPYTIGLDKVFERFDALTHSDGFPKYNIIQEHEGRYVVEVALAGYDKSELEVWTQENVLHVGTVKSFSDDKAYLHKGIARRGFTRTWQLGDDLEVKSSKFDNGILSVVLEKHVPESKRRKVFDIR